ncbi:MAG: vitamin K epoxide reductase family protein [Dehalococcoidia bacterium]
MSAIANPPLQARVPSASPGWRTALVSVLLAVALCGVAVAGYLAWENSRGESGVCTIVHGCSTVQQSKYGKLAGMPVSIPGLGLYLLIAAAAIVWLTNLRGLRQYAILVGAFGSLFGFLLSVFLTYLEAYVIDAWCIYCIVSASLLTALVAGWGAILLAEMRANR